MEYSEQLIQQVWEKGRANGDVSGDLWREDECGAWMSRSDYGKTDSDFGWKIVNVTPGAPDKPENLRPFHHRNGYLVANRHPHCQITADRAGIPPFERTFEPRNRKV